MRVGEVAQDLRCPECRSSVIRTSALKGLMRALAWKCRDCGWEGFTPQEGTPES